MNTAQISDALTELALDLRWAWNHSADDLWRRLDSNLWDLTGNAWFVLQTVSKEKLEAATADPEFEKELTHLIEAKRRRDPAPRWFNKAHPDARLSTVAYFSLEFMLSDALPIYSGGLGNVAGDQLKSASDLGVPVIGVGLLYQVGYFRQHIDAEGNQQALFPFNDPSQLPITPVRGPNGEWLFITVDLPGFKLSVRTWQVQVGRVRLFLLDTNHPGNLPEYRGITSELYGGGPGARLEQERILGIGGWRLLRALGIKPDVCHLNEGHAAFAVLERARSYMEEFHQPFDVALAVTRAGNVFTTHTPVEAGFDRFSRAMLEPRMRQYIESELGVPFSRILALGRANPDDTNEPFNMAYLAIRGSGAINGVSRLHGEVSRRLFRNLFPRWPESEVPIGHVTNGVHTPTWDSIDADQVWTTACGPARWTGDLKSLETGLRGVPGIDLWKMRTKSRKALVDFVRQRVVSQTAGHGGSEREIAAVERVLDPDALTMGFARRFATYKRPNLLLHDRDRLMRILLNRQQPVQLVIAGKAHPADTAGQAMIREWIQFVRHTPARSQVVFLSDYDMTMSEHLVQGVDLWLNTPRRPWEASGTSGMKVLVNGGLNLSELDGWWAEAWTPAVGWAIGDGQEHDADPAWDAAEAARLYELLEQEIVPAFYRRDENGVPQGWVDKMRESMSLLTGQYSANRTVRQYTEEYYLPAAAAVEQRTKDNGALGKSIVEWQRHLDEHWPRLRFEDLNVDSGGDCHAFRVKAYLDELNPDAIHIELYADALPGQEPARIVMQRGEVLIGSMNTWAFTACAPKNRPATDYTPRIVPFHDHASAPLEASRILWYR